jgi:molecular chaperone HscB
MTDPFDLFDVDPAYDLDLGELERRHRDLSRALHPDRYAGRPAAERRQALGKSIEVNDAWRVLRDPVRRAEALMARLGAPVQETGAPPTDEELLMEMLELREELSNARQQRDPEAVIRVSGKVRQRQARLTDSMAADFRAALDKEVGSAEDRGTLDALLRKLAELRYYRKFLEDAAVVEDELY